MPVVAQTYVSAKIVLGGSLQVSERATGPQVDISFHRCSVTGSSPSPPPPPPPTHTAWIAIGPCENMLMTKNSNKKPCQDPLYIVHYVQIMLADLGRQYLIVTVAYLRHFIEYTLQIGVCGNSVP